ncbi:hypothetical protein T08_5605 [Trichinella sp. T8]|nr:hypothetical protein T08_5605 [Trichinella sp. T8]
MAQVTYTSTHELAFLWPDLQPHGLQAVEHLGQSFQMFLFRAPPLNVNPLNVFAISRWKVAGALHRPNGMTLNWKRPIGVEKAVFSRSGSATSTSQYPEARSSVLNH